MFDKFKNYIDEQQLFTPADRIILAVSGGVDSMVMLELFRQLGQDIVVAHCNFHLRDEESDGDEQFVRDYCKRVNVPVYVSQFETAEYARLKGDSIEMAARDLRYNWFEKLRKQLSAKYIATAHHQDDLIETMLINLVRGTGIRGLSGIDPKRGALIRPLLFAGRTEINNWAALNQIDFRVDSSNNELVYQRNVIRHQVLPIMDSLNPAFRKNAVRTAHLLRETNSIYENYIKTIKEKLISERSGLIYIDLKALLNEVSPQSILYELLNTYGFSRLVVTDIFNSVKSESGKQFFSEKYFLVKDRDSLILSEKQHESIFRYYIEETESEISEPILLKFEHLVKSDDFVFSRNVSVADIDLDKLEFPLILKKWEKGEYFQPLGMTGMKKISDFFIDIKLSLPEKENTWILYSGQKVVWIVGYRLDERFKIDSTTRNILRIIS